MKKIILILAMLAGFAQLLTPIAARAQTMPTGTVLILYDNPANDPYSKLGLMYAIMLRNLIGHFMSSTAITNVTIEPV